MVWDWISAAGCGEGTMWQHVTLWWTSLSKRAIRIRIYFTDPHGEIAYLLTSYSIQIVKY